MPNNKVAQEAVLEWETYFYTRPVTHDKQQHNCYQPEAMLPPENLSINNQAIWKMYLIKHKTHTGTNCKHFQWPVSRNTRQSTLRVSDSTIVVIRVWLALTVSIQACVYVVGLCMFICAKQFSSFFFCSKNVYTDFTNWI